MTRYSFWQVVGLVLALLPSMGVQSRSDLEIRTADIPLGTSLARSSAGEVKLHLLVAPDGSVKPESQTTLPMAAYDVTVLRDWRFVSGPGELDFTFSNKVIAPVDPCGPLAETVVVARLPSSLEIQT